MNHVPQTHKVKNRLNSVPNIQDRFDLRSSLSRCAPNDQILTKVMYKCKKKDI